MKKAREYQNLCHIIAALLFAHFHFDICHCVFHSALFLLRFSVLKSKHDLSRPIRSLR